MLAQLEAAFRELCGVVQRKAELQQVNPADAEGIRPHQQVLHLPERARYHGHLHHHGRDRAHRLLHELVHAVLAVARVGRLDAEADLVQAAFGKLLQAALVKQVAARVQARVGVRVKLAGMPEKGVHLLGVQQRLAARDGQAAEPRAHGMRLLELRHDVALMGEEVLVVVLVRVEAEVALLDAPQIDEERGRLVAGAAGQARRRYPVAPQRRGAVLAAAPARCRRAHARLARGGLLALERQAVLLHRSLEVALRLVERLPVALKIHGTLL